MCIECENTCLIWLGNVCEKCVNHSDQHSIFLWMTSVFDDGNDICSLFGNIDKITTGSVRKFDGINDSLRSNNVRNVRNSCSRSSSKIQNFGSGINPDIFNSSKNSGSNL